MGTTAPPDGAVRFSCPICGKEHSVPAGRIPAGGARGNCSACAAGLIVTPDGAARPIEEPPKLSLGLPPAKAAEAASAPPPRALTETPATVAWEIQAEGQTLGPFPLADIRELIRSGRLPEERMVRPAGGAWGEAGSFALLAPLFVPPEKAGATEDSYGSEDACFQHPGVLPTHCCSQCHRYLCGACLKALPTHDGRRTVAACPGCGGPAMAIQRRTRWTPFYKDLGQVFVSPFAGSAWVVFACLVVMEILKRFMGCLGFILLGTLQLTFYLHVIKMVAEGSYEMPDWPDKDNWLDMLVDVLKVLLVSVISVIPLIVIGAFAGAGLIPFLMLAAGSSGGAPGLVVGPLVILFFGLTALYVLYLPICIAIVAVFKTVVPALNPYLIGKIIYRIGTPYLYAAALWVAFTVIQVAIGAILGGVPLAGFFGGSIIAVYFNLLNAYVLGRVIYENEEKIGWQ